MLLLTEECVPGHREYEEGLEKRFADLRDRLQYAEALNRQREDDLFTLRSQFNLLINSLAKNVSAGSVLFFPWGAWLLLSVLNFSVSRQSFHPGVTPTHTLHKASFGRFYHFS